MHLDLAGHKMSRKAKTTDLAMFVLEYGELVIDDSVGTGAVDGKLTRGNNQYGAIIYCKYKGSGVMRDENLTINGGSFNTASFAFGPCIEEGNTGGTVTINGGTFGTEVNDNNLSSVYALQDTKFYVNGGTFSTLSMAGTGDACIRDCIITTKLSISNRKIKDVVSSNSTVTCNGTQVTSLNIQQLVGNIVITDPSKIKFTKQPEDYTFPHAGTTHVFSASLKNASGATVSWHLLDEDGNEISWDTVKGKGWANVSTNKSGSTYSIQLSNVKRAMAGKKLFLAAEKGTDAIKSNIVTISVADVPGDTLFIGGREGNGEYQSSYGMFEQEWIYNNGYTELVDGQSVWQDGGQGMDNMAMAKFTYGSDYGTLELNGYLTYDSAGYEKENTLYGIYYEGNLKIILKGQNEIMAHTTGNLTDVFGIYVTGTLTIEGDGILSINMHQNKQLTASNRAAGIYCGRLIVNGGEIYSRGAKSGIYVKGSARLSSVTLEKGKLRAIGEKYYAIETPSLKLSVSAPYMQGGENTDGNDAKVETKYVSTWKYALLEETLTVTVYDMYRLYNPNSGEHFYTAGADERDILVGYGWQYEGIAWKAPSWSNTPVYRLYNPNAGDHHYTTSAQEKDNLVAVGWQYEGIGWYSDDAKGIGLHRLYNPNAIAGAHHYTTSDEEMNNLVAIGWQYEGIGWYGMK